MIPIIIISGPTAVGKSKLAIDLAQQLNTEIVSADSMQVYRLMDIGTAKPSIAEQHLVKHHLIDLVDPDQPFSVADYQISFDQVAHELNLQNKIPLVVGGTGLYIRAVIQGFIFDGLGGANEEFREELRMVALKHGPEVLHQQLKEVDPDSAIKIHPNDLNRIVRALEIYHTTGRPLSQQPKQRPAGRYSPIYCFLSRERDELYRRIEERVDLMIAEGLIDEVASLLKKGYSPDLKPMQSLGYKQITAYLNNESTLSDAVADIKRLTRNYAKRQLTWFKREPIDFQLNISGGQQEFFRKMLNYIEGRLEDMSNSYN